MTSIDYKTSAPDCEITLTRLLDAPVALVFKAWTDPAHLAQWWGPDCFTNPVCKIDPRPGGALRITMRGPDGSEYPLQGEVLEVVANQRLVYTMEIDNSGNSWDAEQRPAPAVHVISFAAQGTQTLLTVTTRLATAADARKMRAMGHAEGFGSSLNRLAALVAALRNTANA